jgi:hypothetical protein
MTRKNVGGNTKTLVEIPNPFDVIRNSAVIDPNVVLIKREHVRRVRAERAARRVENTNGRAERLARELNIDLESLKRGMGRG